MYVRAEFTPLGPEEIRYRTKALRDAVICIGWMKLLSVFCYGILFCLVYLHSKGKVANLIMILILVVMPLQFVNGVLLFIGALEKKIAALYVCMWLVLFLAAYNTMLGMLGGVYFIRTGYLTMHFFISVFFGVLSLTIFSVLCHDVIVIYTYKKLIASEERSHAYPPIENVSEVGTVVTPKE